jgi:hypothetical protein
MATQDHRSSEGASANRNSKGHSFRNRKVDFTPMTAQAFAASNSQFLSLKCAATPHGRASKRDKSMAHRWLTNRRGSRSCHLVFEFLLKKPDDFRTAAIFRYRAAGTANGRNAHTQLASDLPPRHAALVKLDTCISAKHGFWPSHCFWFPCLESALLANRSFVPAIGLRC